MDQTSKLYINKDNYLIFNEDCLKQMDLLEENSIDSIVTDPPYHLTANKNGSNKKGFMENEWDGGDIAFRKETWEKALRVLKPGGYLLAFGHSRTFHRLAVAIEDAGFEIRDTLMWVYATGFPKSHDMGLQIDKANGDESEIVGEATSGSSSSAYQREGTTRGNYLIRRATNEWAGWGTALKPAYEPIIMARKPFDGTLRDNLLTNGVGALNIDASRISGEKIPVNVSFTEEKQSEGWGTNKPITELKDQGRFPSNLIHDGSDEVIDLLPKNAARFFYSPKANRKDKNDAGLNTHPTPKPTELMRYLVRLVTPPNGVILDPFMGSGSTGKAIFLENKQNLTKNKFIGIELNEEYCELAVKRIDLAINEN